MGAEDIVIPMVAMTTICTTVFGLYYLRNKENMALIEKGMNPRQTPAEPHSFQSLRWGLLFAGGGLGLLIAFLIDKQIARVWFETYSYVNEAGITVPQRIRHVEENEVLYFALIILGAGIGLVTAYLIRKKQERA